MVEVPSERRRLSTLLGSKESAREPFAVSATASVARQIHSTLILVLVQRTGLWDCLVVAGAVLRFLTRRAQTPTPIHETALPAPTKSAAV
jgi:hypothetical protein